MPSSNSLPKDSVLQQLFPQLYPLLFVALWSTGFIGAKFGLPDAEPLTFLSLRYAIVLGLMGSIAWLSKAPWPSRPKDYLHIGISGLLVHGLYLGGVFSAIADGLPAGVTALVVGLQPVLTALGAGAFLGERVRPGQWLGLAFGFAGVGLVVAHKLSANASTALLLGQLAPALLALLAITAGTLYQKRFCPAFDLRSGSVVQFLPCLALTWLAASLSETLQMRWTANFAFALGWLVLVLSLGAVSLLNLLIRRGSAVNVASLFYMVPPTTALFAWALFGETLTGLALAGMGLAVFGVWLARR
ncbi:MAG: DMT family transporter [Paucibacter sp.]|nr:DMT family transporter [Roseateles sp.]